MTTWLCFILVTCGPLQPLRVRGPGEGVVVGLPAVRSHERGQGQDHCGDADMLHDVVFVLTMEKQEFLFGLSPNTSKVVPNTDRAWCTTLNYGEINPTACLWIISVVSLHCQGFRRSWWCCLYKVTVPLTRYAKKRGFSVPSFKIYFCLLDIHIYNSITRE